MTKLISKNIWITSDTHYSHYNICRGISNWIRDSEGNIKENANIESTRDFENLDEMNDAIVNGINDSVDSDDWLIHLGDWSFGGKEMITKLRERINCKNIVLITGNHDKHIKKDHSLHKLFHHVTGLDELVVTQNNNSKGAFLLCHYPIISWDWKTTPYMLHGHQHLRGDDRFTQKNRMDVGLCGHPEFRPYHIEEIINIIDVNNKRLQK